jgi:DNA-binding Lrp family transcriptional regulator
VRLGGLWRHPRKNLARSISSEGTAGDPIDDIDLDMLRSLQADGRMTLRAIGSRVGLSEAPVQRRLRTLERNGWIVGYVARVDPVRANRDFTVFLDVELDVASPVSREAVEARLAALPEVVECHRITGPSCYRVKVVTSGAAAFDVVNLELMALPGFRRAARHVSLARVKDTTALPLPARTQDL